MSDQNTTYDDQFDWDNATSGGLLKEYVGTVTSAEFGIDEDYNDDTVRLMLDLEVLSHDDPDSSVEPGDTFTEAYNVGNVSTWEASPDGKTVSRVDGKRPRFNSSGGYGRLLESVKPDAKTSMEGADKLIAILRERGPATNAKIWEGLTFRFERMEFSFENAEKETITYQRVYPTAFLGEGAAAADTGSSTPSATEATADATSGPTRADLVALAAEHDKFASFLADAMKKFPGVEDGELAEDLMNEKEGVFAEAHS